MDDTTTEVDRLLREANILRMRGQYAEAETRCRGALEREPEDLSAIEMLADLVYEKGSLEEARSLCLKALDLQPGRASAETRLAKVTLDLAERERARHAAEALLQGGDGGPAGRERKRRVTISLLLSFLLPGAGQFYNGELVKALVIAVVFLICVGVGGSELLTYIFALMGSPQAARAARGMPGWTAVFGFVGFGIYIYALIDAAARAQKMSGSPGFGDV